MKLFKQLLVAPAALGLLAPVAVSAAELNVSGVNQYAASSQEQVTSISQFSDVRPTDWAYQALSNLIERYGCVAGYPNGTFKGGQAMTRYEAAALLNACLDRISEVTDELKKLMAEFEKELAVLRGRVDGLEAKVGELEANQFSTTTKLKGIATFVLGANSYSGSSNFFQRLSAAPAGRPGPQFSVPANYVPGTNDVSYLKGIQGATTFNYDVRLNFDTSFTGKDLLRTTLRAGNAANTAYANGILPNNGLEAFFQDTTIPGSNANNIVGINRLFYQFPIGKSWTATVGGRVRQDDMLAMWPSAYPADTILDFFTYAGSPAAYSLNLGAGAGLWYRNNGFSLSANYVAQNGQNGSPSIDNCGGRIGCGGIGTDASAQTFTAQAGYAANNWGAAVAYTYGNGTTIPAGTPLASFGNFNGFSANLPGIATNTVGLSAYWQPSKSGLVPSISTGWGITGFTGGDSSLTPAINESLSGARAQSWYVGLQWADAFIKGNALGMAVGQTPFITTLPTAIRGQNGFAGSPNDGNYAWEWWYKFQVTDNISVTPAIFYLSNPLGAVGNAARVAADESGAALTNFGGIIKTTFKF